RQAARWTEVPSERVAAAAEHAGDGVVAVGGGSSIDLGKAISAEADVPVVSVPTTYAGAEWTPYFGIRDPQRKMKGGGTGAHLRAVVYEPELTLSLPREETVGTALNALCLPEALRYNEAVAPDAVRRFREAVGTDVEELARLGGFERLRDFGVPEAELGEVAVATAGRAGAKANPRAASPAEIAEL